MGFGFPTATMELPLIKKIQKVADYLSIFFQPDVSSLTNVCFAIRSSFILIFTWRLKMVQIRMSLVWQPPFFFNPIRIQSNMFQTKFNLNRIRFSVQLACFTQPRVSQPKPVTDGSNPVLLRDTHSLSLSGWVSSVCHVFFFPSSLSIRRLLTYFRAAWQHSFGSRFFSYSFAFFRRIQQV